MENNYRKLSARRKIAGYFLPTPQQEVGLNGGLEGAFNNAKAELLKAMEREMLDVQVFTFAHFNEKIK